MMPLTIELSPPDFWVSRLKPANCTSKRTLKGRCPTMGRRLRVSCGPCRA